MKKRNTVDKLKEVYDEAEKQKEANKALGDEDFPS